MLMIAGEAVLVDDTGETLMRAGDVAAFPKGDRNGHCLRNDSADNCVFVAIGRPSTGACHYPDIDLHLPAGGPFTRKDGAAFD